MKERQRCARRQRERIYVVEGGGRKERGGEETNTKRANRARREKRDTGGRTWRGNPAVGQADKPLRDFSLALLSSIDVDSKLRRRKAPGGASESIPLLRSSHPRSSFLIVRATRETPPRTILRFLRGFADTSDSRTLPISSRPRRGLRRWLFRSLRDYLMW